MYSFLKCTEELVIPRWDRWALMISVSQHPHEHKSQKHRYYINYRGLVWICDRTNADFTGLKVFSITSYERPTENKKDKTQYEWPIHRNSNYMTFLLLFFLFLSLCGHQKGDNLLLQKQLLRHSEMLCSFDKFLCVWTFDCMCVRVCMGERAGETPVFILNLWSDWLK